MKRDAAAQPAALTKKGVAPFSVYWRKSAGERGRKERKVSRVSGRMTLAGAWLVRDAGGGSPAGRAWLPARVPGCIHLDLMRARKIPDPFFGTNENDVQWVGGRDWEYRRTFRLERTHPALAAERVELVFEGLDTFAEVRLNGREVGRADNMFIPWRFRLPEGALRPGRNTLQVRFASVEGKIQRRREAHPRLAALFGDRDRAFVRKAQCHFGWDWGPRLVTCGIWRPCRLEWFEVARITDVFARTARLTRRSAVVEVEVQTERLGRQREAVCEVVLAREGRREVQSQRITLGSAAIFTFTLSPPDLWWPNGCGEQPLYDLTVRLRRDGRDVPLQTRVTGWWPDHSIKWLLLTFPADADQQVIRHYIFDRQTEILNEIQQMNRNLMKMEHIRDNKFKVEII